MWHKSTPEDNSKLLQKETNYGSNCMGTSNIDEEGGSITNGVFCASPLRHVKKNKKNLAPDVSDQSLQYINRLKGCSHVLFSFF